MVGKKATPAARRNAEIERETPTGRTSRDFEPDERPNKALTEGPEGGESVEARAEVLTHTLAAAVGGGPEAEKAARPIAEAMAQRQVDEVPSRAEREARDAGK